MNGAPSYKFLKYCILLITGLKNTSIQQDT